MLRAARSPGFRDFPGFRLRGGEVTRLEAFSDAVFGFALTLLVVSLDVPRTFDDLLATMRGFPAFALCFLLLAVIWNGHYKFCRRYGLEDGTARFLTCTMLFLVLFFVYPLKFLFNLSITDLLFGHSPNATPVNREQISMLLLIYGLGFAAVYGALALLYVHAWRLRAALELNELERFDTRHHIYRLLLLVAAGLLAAFCSRIPALMPYSGFVYFAIFPALRIHRFVHRRKRQTLFAAGAG
jgi:uncharacterized membrane protein